MKLTVDEKQVRMNVFVQKVLTNLAQSILVSLDDVPEKSQDVVFEFRTGSGIEIRLAQQSLRMNDFVQKLTENVFKAVIRSLDDVPTEPQCFTLTL